MVYRPSSLVSVGKVTFVSTLVASTFTPAITLPLGSVTRPVSVAVGPASSGSVITLTPNNISSKKPECLDVTLFDLLNSGLPNRHSALQFLEPIENDLNL